MKNLKVLHIDTEKDWRGGQAQVYNLIKHLPENVDSYLITPGNSELSARLKDSGIEVNINYSSLRGEPDLFSALDIGLINKNKDFDIIHAHSSTALGIAWIAGFFFDLPPLVETRRLELKIAKNILSKYKYRSVEKHIANSQGVKEVLIDSGIDPETVEYIPTGIDLEAIDSTEPDESVWIKEGIEPDNILIGNIGSLCEQKDQKTFIEAAAEVNEKHPGTRFVIAGEGPLKNELETKISDLGLSDVCFLAGFVENIIGLLKTFDVFVLTSLYEGLCGTLLQAMSCRVPVISSDVRGSKEILLNNDTCRVVEPGNVKQFAGELSNMIENRTLKKKLTNNARELAEKYDYGNLALKTAEIYKSTASHS